MEDADVILAAVADATNDVVHDADADDEAELDDVTAIQTLLSILGEKDEFPVQQQRNGTLANLARTFLRNFNMDVQDMITDGDFGTYRGLDATRDTEAEVEQVLRIFPELLSKRNTTKLVWNYPQTETETTMNGSKQTKMTGNIPFSACHMRFRWRMEHIFVTKRLFPLSISLLN